MKINKKKFNQLVKKVTDGQIGDFPQWMIEDLSFQYIDIKKNRNEDNYDIIVSVDVIDTSLVAIRDIIEFVCGEMGIKHRRTIVEI